MKFLILGQLREFTDNEPPTVITTVKSVVRNRDVFTIEADEITIDGNVIKFLNLKKEKFGADLVATVPSSYLVIREDVNKTNTEPKIAAA